MSTTITMQGVARLARVQRPVVSMWRSRSRGSADPFPAPLREDAPSPLFDAGEVAAWLARTGRGNNPDAALDAAAHAAPATDADSTSGLTALLALRELHGAPIGALSDVELQQLALQADPTDGMLQAEVIAAAGDLPALARHVDAAVDADYTASAAMARLLGTADRTDLGLSLSAAALDLCEAVVHSLIADVSQSAGASPALTVPPTGATPLLRRLIASVDRDIDIVVRASTDSDDLRMLRRVLAVERHHAGTQPSVTDGRAPAVHLAQLPVVGGLDAVSALTAIDDLVLSMTDADRAVVIGPASLLVDELGGEADRVRSGVLRLGRVRAIARLPRGFAPGASRAHLALWVVGAHQADLPVAERRVLTVDLHQVAVTDDIRHDVVLDLVSGLGGGYERHLRAFRFAVPVALRSLLARGQQLVVPRIRAGSAEDDAALVSRFLDASGRLAVDEPRLPLFATTESPTGPLPPALLGDLVRDRLLRRVPGSRLPADALTADASAGFRVIGAATVRGAETEPRYVDRMRFAQLPGGGRLTEPGDVIVVGGDRPAALLDRLGANAVEAPAAILRADARSDGSIEPVLLQHDVGRFARGDWRTWVVRRLRAGDHVGLRASIDDLSRRVAALRDQIARLEEYERALVDGYVAGVLRPEGERSREKTEQGGH